MASIELSARPRTVLGKKAKLLRLQGIIPANIYGRNIPSTAIEVPQAELRRVIKAAGHTGLVQLSLEGEAAPRNAVIRGIQRKFTTGNVIHVDFQEVSMTRRMTVRVPIVLEGSAPVTDLDGVIVQSVDAIDVECLPGDIPQHIVADISGMTAFDSQIHVHDIKTPAGVTILTDPSILLATVTTASREEEPTEEAEEAEEATATEEPESPSEG